MADHQGGVHKAGCDPVLLGLKDGAFDILDDLACEGAFSVQTVKPFVERRQEGFVICAQELPRDTET